MEKISVLVPCCNVEPFVRECLESIKNQTYKNLEVICIDDGSKDGTGAIIDEFVAADPRFKAIHKPNSGYGDSMNMGLEQCSGDYVGIVESDDWIEPDMYETLLNTAKEHHLDLVRCCWYEGPTGTETINCQDWVKKNAVYRPMDRIDVFYQQPSIWAALYLRDLLEEGRKVRFLPTPGASYQDTSFAFKVYTKSQRFLMLDRPLHHYRINPNSSVSSSGKVYCVIDEWEEMRQWVCGDDTLCKAFSELPLFERICQGGLMWNYERLSSTVLKLLFLRRASRFFRQATADGVMPLKRSNHDVRDVMESPLDFHRNQTAGRCNTLKMYEGKYAVLQDEDSQRDMVSVVVTCYNTSKYIQSCLDSISGQSYRNIEIICVDDCSKDDSEVLVRHCMRKDKRIKWLSTGKNSGLSASRNLGIAHCKGKYIMFVDGDDCLLPDTIGHLMAAKQEGDDVVMGGIVVDYEGGEALYGPLVESDNRYYSISVDKSINALEDLEEANSVHVSACGKLWSLAVIKEHQLTFPEGMLYEDACFFWKYLCVAPHLHTVKGPVYLYQRHLSGSIMSDTFGKKPGMAIQHILIMDDMFAFAQQNRKGEEMKKILNRLYEPFFWFAYNNSPTCDDDAVCDNMCRILREQEADTTTSPILEHLTHYQEASKGELFIKALGGEKPSAAEQTPIVNKLSSKLKKYRKLTKVFALSSIVLFLALLAALVLLV